LLPCSVARAEGPQHPAAEAKADPEPKAKPPAAPTSPSPAPSEAEQAAEAAYQRALTAYAAGDLQGEFENMRESYRLSQRPELLYNLALLERELRQCTASLEDYRRYLQQVPQGRYRDEAERARIELERECPAVDAQPAPVAPAPGPAAPAPSAPAETTPPSPPVAHEASYWSTPHILAWSAIGAGAAAGAASLSFELAAKSTRNEVATNIERAVIGQAKYDPNLRNRQHHQETEAIVLGITGGALVTSGVLYLLLGPHAASPSDQAFFYFPPAGLGAGYAHSF
jgi:TolA-binding protein